MNEATTFRTHARNAATAFAAQAQRLSKLSGEQPDSIDSEQDFDAFMTTRALWRIYRDCINLTMDGESPLADVRIIDRIQDKRRTMTAWLLRSKSQQGGLYAVTQHIAQEAARKFLADTAFADQD